jgi:TonB family protein
MRFNKDDVIAFLVAVAVHLILLLLLWLSIMRTALPNEDSGILIDFGEMYASVGVNEPHYTERTPQREVPPPQPKATTTSEELVTQSEEETVYIPDKKKKETEDKAAVEKARQEAEAKRRAEDERLKREKEQQQQSENISNLASKAFGQSSAPEAQQGDQPAGTGNQGNPFGNADQGANTGTGGFGSFNLNGRSIGSGGLPRPAYNSQQEGKVVINITVDPNGNVINANFGRGTNTDDADLRNSARDAALKAKFNKIKDNNNQVGTITYNFKLY